MGRREFAEWNDPEEAEEWEEDDSDEVETVSCPLCRQAVYEDAEQCPHCGEYIVLNSNTSVLADRPVWFQALAILGIIAVIAVSILLVY